MRNLKKDSHAVSCLSLCIFSGSVFQVLHDMECSLHRQMALDSLAVYHCADSTVVMFKGGTVQSLLLFSHHIFLPICFFFLFHTRLLLLRILGTADGHGLVWISIPDAPEFQ